MRARPLTWARQGLGPSLAAWCPAPARQGTGSASARRFQRQQAAHLQAGTGLLGLLLWRGPATAASVCPPAHPAARRCLPARCRRPDPCMPVHPPTKQTHLAIIGHHEVAGQRHQVARQPGAHCGERRSPRGSGSSVVRRESSPQLGALTPTQQGLGGPPLPGAGRASWKSLQARNARTCVRPHRPHGRGAGDEQGPVLWRVAGGDAQRLRGGQGRDAMLAALVAPCRATQSSNPGATGLLLGVQPPTHLHRLAQPHFVGNQAAAAQGHPAAHALALEPVWGGRVGVLGSRQRGQAMRLQQRCC